MRILSVLLISGIFLPILPQAVVHENDWPVYGRDPGGTRFSPLTQINARNVAQLQRAWTYHTGEQGHAFETTRSWLITSCISRLRTRGLLPLIRKPARKSGSTIQSPMDASSAHFRIGLATVTRGLESSSEQVT